MAAAKLRYIELVYEDGTVSTFEKVADEKWNLTAQGLPICADYDPPNVLRVVSNGVGTREVAE